MMEYLQIYAAGVLATAFVIALVGDNKAWWLDLLRVAIWPVTLATFAGQFVRALCRAVF